MNSHWKIFFSAGEGLSSQPRLCWQGGQFITYIAVFLHMYEVMIRPAGNPLSLLVHLSIAY